MTNFPGWTLPDQDSLDRQQGEAAPVQGLPLDARLCAWIVGLAVAALIALFFGDHLAMWAGIL